MSKDTGELIRFRVSPGASRSEITGCVEDVWQARVAAPPVEGKANAELVKLLSKALGVSRSSVVIVKGHTGRHKAVAVKGMSREEITSRLSV